jgi:hypothetical protein
MVDYSPGNLEQHATKIDLNPNFFYIGNVIRKKVL